MYVLEEAVVACSKPLDTYAPLYTRKVDPSLQHAAIAMFSCVNQSTAPKDAQLAGGADSREGSNSGQWLEENNCCYSSGADLRTFTGIRVAPREFEMRAENVH